MTLALFSGALQAATESSNETPPANVQRPCHPLLEKLSYFVFHAKVNLWEANIRFFDLSDWSPEQGLDRQIDRLIFYVRKQAPGVMGARRDIIAQIKIYRKRVMDDQNPFRFENAPRLFGKPALEVSFQDLLAYFRNNQQTIQDDLSQGSYGRRPPALALGVAVVGTAAVMAFGSLAYRWTNSVAGNVFSAPSEYHGSVSRQLSFIATYGNPQFESELSKAAFELYNADAREYPQALNVTKGLWEQYGFENAFLVTDYIASATRSLQINAISDNFESVREVECKRLYQIFFAFPEYFQSHAEGELSQAQRLFEVLQAYDPDQSALRSLFSSWADRDKPDFEWSEDDVTEVLELLNK